MVGCVYVCKLFYSLGKGWHHWWCDTWEVLEKWWRKSYKLLVGKKKENLIDQGKQVQRPCGWHVLDVFGVSVAGVDELEEDSRVGGGTCWSLWRTRILPWVRWEPLGGGKQRRDTVWFIFKKIPLTDVTTGCSGDRNGTRRTDLSPMGLVGRSVIAKPRNKIM